MAEKILLITSRPQTPERDEEYNSWYNNYLIQQMLKLPGFRAGTRYRLSHLQMEWFPPAANVPQWPYGKAYTYLTVYEIDPAVDNESILANLPDLPESEELPADWGECWLLEPFTQREGPVRLRAEGFSPERPDGAPNHLFLVPISPLSPELDEDFNRWYIAQVNIVRPGFAAGTRYKLSTLQPPRSSGVGETTVGGHDYLMVYELYDLLAAYNDLRTSVERARQRSGEGTGRYSWQKPWGSLRRVDEHIVYEPVTNRVTPIWLK